MDHRTKGFTLPELLALLRRRRWRLGRASLFNFVRLQKLPQSLGRVKTFQRAIEDRGAINIR